MKVWMLQQNGILEEQNRPEVVTQKMQVKVKLSKVLITENDVELLSGKFPSAIYPIIPGHTAVGVLSETCACGIDLTKGARVYLHPLFPCGVCENCKKDSVLDCTDMHIAGVNAHGFLRDFAVVNLNDVSLLPSSVSDEQALFVEWIALAESVLDTLDCSKGDHVVIYGASILGNLLAQLLIYRKIVPILIDTDVAFLDYAKKCGVYYTFKLDNTLRENIMKVTGGRLADASVYAGLSDVSPSLPFVYAAPCTNVVYAGLRFKDVEVNLKNALLKQCAVYCVTQAKKHISSAINILANKAITLPDISYRYGTIDDLPNLTRLLQIGKYSFLSPYIIKLL